MESIDGDDVYGVEVVMRISKKGKEVENKSVDFGQMKEAQLKGLVDLFTMIAQNIEYLKKLTPQFEKLDRSKPAYLQ